MLSLAASVLIILIDDVGHDLLAEASTPNIDAFSEESRVYENAWAMPICSPTRAAMLTGKYPFRTGVGFNVNLPGNYLGLDTSEPTLGEIAPNSAWVGKWHLSQGDDVGHPLAFFDVFSGSMRNLKPCCGHPLGAYYCWKHTEGGGAEACETTYATDWIGSESLDVLSRLDTPRVVVISSHAAHGPVPPGKTSADLLEDLDEELGSILNSASRNDWVFLLGDNGTQDEGKGTLYEAGVGVPFMLRGPNVEAGSSSALVSVVDIFATVAEIAGSSQTAEDSESLLSGLRTVLYAERFEPNGDPGDADYWNRAARDGRWKLIRRFEQGELIEEEFYDLLSDPEEEEPLTASGPHYEALLAYMESLR